jgi:diacylglycerol kinase
MESPVITRTHDKAGRSPWRQRLVQAERGFALGFRSDSIFFVHLFLSTAAICAAVVTDFRLTQWAVLVFAMATSYAAELFHQVVKMLLNDNPSVDVRRAQAILRMSTAATTLTIVGGSAAVLLLFAERLDRFL